MSAEHREFAALVDAHGAAVLALLRRLCGNPHDADDVFQDTAARVWRHLASRPRLANPRAWLMTVAYRAFLDFRSRGRRHARQSQDGLEDKADDWTLLPDRRAEHNEDVDRLQQAMTQLPETVREVLVLHYTGGLTLRETGGAIGIVEGTVKSRLHAGLKQLRDMLQ